MVVRRSLLAVGAALAAALATQLLLAGGLRLAAPALASVRLDGAALRAALITAYLLGTGFAAIAAGVALGRLAPTKPSLHVAAAALLGPLIGYLLSGASALPHGWQIVGYGIQLILTEAVTLVVFHRRPGWPIHLSTRPA